MLPVPEENLCYGDICIPHDYNKLEPPFREGKPLEVRISADGVRAQEFDDKKFTVSFSMFLSVQWTEERLIGPEASATQPFRAISTRFVENLWVPDIYIYNMNRINRILTDYKGKDFLSDNILFAIVSGQLFIVNGKDIYFRQEVVITLWCPMRFDFYPLDKQVLKDISDLIS